MSESKTYTEEQLATEIAKAQKGLRNELTTERDKNKTQLDTLTAELEALKDAQDTAASDKEKVALEKKGEYDKALEQQKNQLTSEYQKIIDAEKAKNVTLTAENRKFKVDNQIISHAGDANNPDHVVTMLTSLFDIKTKDDGTLEIFKRDGTPVLDEETAKPVNLKELTEGFLVKNPQYVKASSDGGSGTLPSKTKESDSLEKQIEAAIEAGDKQKVILLKSQKMRRDTALADAGSKP